MYSVKESRRYLLILMSLVWLGSASADELQLQQGSELLTPYKQQLKQALQTGLADGALAAIEACGTKAPTIAAGLSTGDIRMGRSSHKLRNPDNAPEPWAQAVIDNYLQHPAAREPVAVQLADGRTGYAEPIVTQPMCLLCHGDNLNSALQAQLDAEYPEDQATGFAAGDLRGIFWVEFVAN
jgi:hypothetical protein